MNSQKLCRALIALAVCLCTAMRGMDQAPTPAVAQAATQENPGFFKRWGQYFWPTKPHISATNALYYGNPSRTYYYANSRGQNIGFLQTLPEARATKINLLVVQKRFRHQGVGSLLLQKALDDARNERRKMVDFFAVPIEQSSWSNKQLDAWYIQQIQKWASQNYADVAKVEIIGPIGHEFQIKLTYPEECVDGGY